MTILQDVGSENAMLNEIAKLRAENDRLKARQAHKLSCKVSAKGAVSVYGMGRWPVTLYRSQWEALLKFMPTVEEFLIDNLDQLKDKGDAE